MSDKKTDHKIRPLPDLEKCWVAEIGLDGFAECRMSGPNQCSHAVPFGYCFLCSHPRLNEIIEKNRERRAVSSLN